MRILVTGASRGIGRAVARELARRGHQVVATAREPATLQDLPVTARLPLDVTRDDSVRAAAEAAGAIDVLVNNAGDISLAPVESVPLEEVQRLYELNVFGALRVVQAFAPGMRERRAGTIVNMSSMLGRIGVPLAGVYASTKWALEGLSESLRLELAHFGVDVVLVEPGAVSSGALDRPRAFFDADDPYLPLASERRLSASRMSTPEAVAQVVAQAIESPRKAFRWRVGPDANLLLAARAQLDDVLFEGALRSALKLNW
jgi:NAD(P)-dependent dehydrogenase (short-subunit alcohol dehydrogenase family)